MVSLTPDKALLERLREANGPVEFRDEDGVLIGVFAPVTAPTTRQARGKVRTREEEAALLADLERRARDPGPDCTFSQAFEHLLSLTSDPIQQAMLRNQIESFKERERCDSPS
jgi:hypothetical protein